MSAYSLKNIFRYFFLGIFTSLVVRKIIVGKAAMDYVRECKDQVDFEAMISDPLFSSTVSNFSSKPRMIVIQNQHALNMTFNWLCNTVSMADVHENTVIVTLDEESKISLQETWPKITVLHWPIRCLKNAFNYGDGRYQLFYLFRSNLARAFLHFDKSFWMIQQDTFWRESLLNLQIENVQKSADIIFDRAAEGQEMESSIIAGGYYFARPTCSAKAFFKQLSHDLEIFYTPDNAYMTSLCANGGLAKCGHVPFSVITNWIWLHDPGRLSDAQKIPILIQFDGDTKLGGKLGKMKSLGFYFVKEDGRTCNPITVKKAQILVLKQRNSINTASVKAYSHLQFGLYQWFIDQFYKSKPTRSFMEKVIFPYAHYFMITL